MNNEIPPLPDEEHPPEWAITFADLMILLLCFFILILSFSEMNRQKFKRISGSLERAFGMQKRKKIQISPLGMKIIAMNFDQEAIALKIKEEIAMEIQRNTDGEGRRLSNLVEVEYDDEEIVIRLMGETTFDSGKAEIRKNMIPILRKIGDMLKDMKLSIVIAGHTDNVPIIGGIYRSNLVLSMARAASVAEFFINEISIPPKRIATMGFGEYRPIASNDIEEGRKKNRRVEIILSNASYGVH